MRLSKKHGKILSFNIYGVPVIVLNDAALTREAFQMPSLSDKGFNNPLQVRLTGKCCKFYIFVLLFIQMLLKLEAEYQVVNSTF